MNDALIADAFGLEIIGRCCAGQYGGHLLAGPAGVFKVSIVKPSTIKLHKTPVTINIFLMLMLAEASSST